MLQLISFVLTLKSKVLPQSLPTEQPHIFHMAQLLMFGCFMVTLNSIKYTTLEQVLVKVYGGQL